MDRFGTELGNGLVSFHIGSVRGLPGEVGSLALLRPGGHAVQFDSPQTTELGQVYVGPESVFANARTLSVFVAGPGFYAVQWQRANPELGRSAKCLDKEWFVDTLKYTNQCNGSFDYRESGTGLWRNCQFVQYQFRACPFGASQQTWADQVIMSTAVTAIPWAISAVTVSGPSQISERRRYTWSAGVADNGVGDRPPVPLRYEWERSVSNGPWILVSGDGQWFSAVVASTDAPFRIRSRVRQGPGYVRTSEPHSVSLASTFSPTAIILGDSLIAPGTQGVVWTLGEFDSMDFPTSVSWTIGQLDGGGLLASSGEFEFGPIQVPYSTEGNLLVRAVSTDLSGRTAVSDKIVSVSAGGCNAVTCGARIVGSRQDANGGKVKVHGAFARGRSRRGVGEVR
jgi:hypothetical protein